MKKYFLLLFIFLFSLLGSACSSLSPTAPELGYRLSSVSLVDNTLSFDIYLERPDLALKQPDNDGLVELEDLPEGLRPETISIIRLDGNIKSACKKNYMPHNCSFTVDFEEGNLSQLLEQYLLKVDFMDGVSVEQNLLLPNVLPLDKPEITPIPEENDDKTILTFKNVEASEYNVNLALCYDYANDGINPCLDDEDYVISFKDGLMVLNENESFYAAELKTFSDNIQIDFEFDPRGYNSIYYSVTAVDDGGIYKGASAYRSSSDILEIFLD